jgi:hypothetical protein
MKMKASKLSKKDHVKKRERQNIMKETKKLMEDLEKTHQEELEEFKLKKSENKLNSIPLLPMDIEFKF